MEELRRRQVLAQCLLAIPGAVDDGEVVVVDGVRVGREATADVELARGPQVDDGAQAERLQQLEVVGREAAETVGAEDPPPPDGATVVGRPSAEVAKVEDAVEGDGTGGGRRVHDLDGRGSPRRDDDGTVTRR